MAIETVDIEGLATAPNDRAFNEILSRIFGTINSNFSEFGSPPDMSAIEAAIDALETDVAALQGDVASNAADVAALTSTVGTLASDVTTLQGTVGDIGTDVSALIADLDAAELAIAALDTDKADAIHTHNATDIDAGTLDAARLPDDGVTNARLANMAAETIKGNNTGAPADPVDMTVSQTRTLLAIDNIDNTSDADKPVSTAQQTALDGKAAFTHNHPAADISDASADGRSLITAANYPAMRALLDLEPGTDVQPFEGAVALTDGATPALNAALGAVFTLAASGNRTIAVPTNPTAGQKIVIAHTAVSANRTLALNTGTGGFRYGSDVAALSATVSGKTDYIGAIYNAAADKWDVVAYAKGY